MPLKLPSAEQGDYGFESESIYFYFLNFLSHLKIQRKPPMRLDIRVLAEISIIYIISRSLPESLSFGVQLAA